MGKQTPSRRCVLHADLHRRGMSAGCAGDGRMCLEIIGCPKNGAIRSSNSWSWRNPLMRACWRAKRGLDRWMGCSAGISRGTWRAPGVASCSLMRPANEDARGSRAEAGAAQVPQGRRPRAICRVNRSMVPWKSPGPVAELVLPRGARRLRASGGISLLDLCIFALPEAPATSRGPKPILQRAIAASRLFFHRGKAINRGNVAFP